MSLNHVGPTMGGVDQWNRDTLHAWIVTHVTHAACLHCTNLHVSTCAVHLHAQPACINCGSPPIPHVHNPSTYDLHSSPACTNPCMHCLPACTTSAHKPIAAHLPACCIPQPMQTTHMHNHGLAIYMSQVGSCLIGTVVYDVLLSFNITILMFTSACMINVHTVMYRKNVVQEGMHVGNATALLLYPPPMSVLSNVDALVVQDTHNVYSPPARPPGTTRSSISGTRTCSHTRHSKVLDPATSHQHGSISCDWDHGFNLEWESPEDFHKWHENKQWAHGIELHSSQTRGSCASTTQSTLFSGSWLYVCAHQGTGGIKKYERKTKQENQERQHIQGGCLCQVRIKVYPHTLTVLRKYTLEHSHLTGKDNLKYVWIHVPMLEQITGLIRLWLTDKEIVCDTCILLTYESNVDLRKKECATNLVQTRGTTTSLWMRFPKFEKELIERLCLDPNDANSTWI